MLQTEENSITIKPSQYAVLASLANSDDEEMFIKNVKKANEKKKTNDIDYFDFTD